MLFLYSDCRDFLVASMRYGETRRRTVRHLFNELRQEPATAARWTEESVTGLTDLEVAGLVWQLQIARFDEYLKRLGDRAASLDCRAFLTNPREVLGEIWRFLDIPGEPSESPICDPGFLKRHVKYPDEPFTPEARLKAPKHVDPRIMEEVDRLVEASCALLPKGTLPLPNPLVAVEQAQ
jgi:hypothetical protein